MKMQRNLLTPASWTLLSDRFSAFHDSEIISIEVAQSQTNDGYDAHVALSAIDHLRQPSIVKLEVANISRAVFSFDKDADYRCVRFEVRAMFSNDKVYLELGDCPEPEATIDDFLGSDRLVVGSDLYHVPVDA